MKKQTKTMTPQQAERAGAEYRKLLVMAQEQLTEHKLWLTDQLQRLNPFEHGLSPQAMGNIIVQVGEMKLAMIRTEPAMKDGDQPTVSVIYEYPDELYDLLIGLPGKLNPAEQGGITLGTEAPEVKA